MLTPSNATFLEYYGRGGICTQANKVRRDLNVHGLGALDLRTTKPSGDNWDFSKKADRKEAMNLINQLEPDFIIGSPPCTAFCAWNQHLNFKKMKKEDVERIMADGRMHLQFMARVYWKQIRGGRHFLHEHPATAVSWSENALWTYEA